jgi:predicted ATPase/DNA-binding SARP family transcriptional activator
MPTKISASPPTFDTPPLSVRLFGPFELRIDGTPVPKFATAQGQALLAWLCLNPQPHPRARVADLLWPEYTPDKANQNLRKTLSRMRGGLQPHAEGLAINRQTVQLLPALYEVDALRFNGLLAECKSHSHRAVERCAACCARLEEAVSLYRGELLAGGNSDESPDFEEWLLVQREHFHRQAVDALQILLEHQRGLQDHRAVHRLAQRLLELEPFQESAHARLIESLALQGEGQTALAHYERAVALLADELGVAPGDDLLGLGQRLRHGSAQSGARDALTRSIAEIVSGGRYHHFPPSLTPFFGRETEAAHIVERLADPNCRLLTVTGPGGIGKSRLVVEAARRLNPLDFADGLYFISLAPLEQSTEVVQAIIAALDLPLAEGLPMQRQLLRGLADKHLLLILDNFEHLLESAPLLLTILDRAPGVSCLISSRLPLQVQAEWQFPLDGLEYPPETGQSSPWHLLDSAPAETRAWQEYSAVAFFLDRARRVRPGFAPDEAGWQAILKICRLVEGMPLALTMAAAWLASHTLDQMVAQLDRSLDLFVAPLRDLPPRHQSMRATFAVSWALLPDPTQQTLARLSIFRGSFDGVAAQTVAGATPLELAQLVTAALVISAEAGRYSLHELLRQFAAEKLAESEQADGVRRAYSRYYLSLLANEAANLHADNQSQAVQRLRQEMPNLHAAWSAAGQDRQWPLIAESLPAYFRLLHILALGAWGQSQLATVSEALNRLLAHSRATVDGLEVTDREALTELLVRLKLAEGRLLVNAAPFAQSESVLTEALRVVGELTDPAPDLLGEIYLALATHYNQQGRRAQAREYVHRASHLLRHSRNYALQAILHLEMATHVGERNELPLRRAYFEEAVRLAERSGDLLVDTLTRRYLIHIQFRMGDFSQADHHLQRLLRNARQLQSPMAEAMAYTYLGGYYFYMGDFERIAAYDAQSLPLIFRVGAPLPMGRIYMRQGLQALYAGNLEAGLQVTEEALAHARTYKSLDVEAAVLILQGRLHLAQAQWENGWAAFARADEIQNQQGLIGDYMSAPCGLAAVHLARSERSRASVRIESLLPDALQGNLGLVSDRGFVYLNLYRVLDANRDPRAEPLLQQALSTLAAIAATIADESYRRSFWEAVPEYRELRRLGRVRGLLPA